MLNYVRSSDRKSCGKWPLKPKDAAVAGAEAEALVEPAVAPDLEDAPGVDPGAVALPAEGAPEESQMPLTKSRRTPPATPELAGAAAGAEAADIAIVAGITHKNLQPLVVL